MLREDVTDVNLAVIWGSGFGDNFGDPDLV